MITPATIAAAYLGAGAYFALSQIASQPAGSVRPKQSMPDVVLAAVWAPLCGLVTLSYARAAGWRPAMSYLVFGAGPPLALFAAVLAFGPIPI
jgi:hypothetical protein